MDDITLGSLFDGLGGWLIAAKVNGIRPIWASEIEPAPMRITEKWHPEVKQLGDITKINIDELEIPTVITCGSPCQDLSIAGKRAGMGNRGDEEVTRSGLFRTAIDIVHGLRQRPGGEKLRFFVYENVPGAFTSNKGMDFKAVLEEIMQAEIPMPKDGRWAESGMVECGRVRVEWTVLDPAQLGWSPQRRKRIFLVADFARPAGGGGEILSFPTSMLRDFEARRTAGEENTAEAGAGATEASGALLGNSFKDNPLTEGGRVL